MDDKFLVGSRELNRKKLQDAIMFNADTYALAYKFNDKQRKEFNDAVQYGLLGMNDGSISMIDPTGNMLDSKGTGNSMMNHFVHFVKDLTKNDRQNKLAYSGSSTTSGKSKKKYSNRLENDFKDYFNGGTDPDSEFFKTWHAQDLADSSGNRGTLNRAAAYSKMLQEKLNRLNNDYYDMGDFDKNTEIANLQTAINVLKDGKVDENEKIALTKAGHSAKLINLIFGNGEVTTTSDWETQKRLEYKDAGYTDAQIEEQIAMDKQEKQWDIDDRRELSQDEHQSRMNDRLRKQHDKKWRQFAERTYTQLSNPSKRWALADPTYTDKNSYFRAIADLKINPHLYYKLWLANPNGYTGKYKNSDYLKNYLYYMAQNDYDKMFIGDSDDEGNVTGHIIKSTINPLTGKALSYDGHSIREISPLESKALRDSLKSLWLKKNPYPVHSSTSGTSGSVWAKEGGVIKALLGTTVKAIPSYDFSTPTNDLLAEANEFVAKENKAKLAARAKSKGRSADYQEYLEGNDSFSAADNIRLVNLVNDLSSIATSYVPIYGTAISGVLGLASMGLDLAADIKDEHVSADLVWDNLIDNAKFAALGMIPGGAGKVGKIWKGIKRLLPAGMSAMGLTESMLNPEVQASLKKLKDGKFTDLNNGDYKNLMQLTKMVAFTHNTGKGAAQSYSTWIKNNKYAPSVLREWGDKSFDILGTKKDVALNAKMLKLGSLQSPLEIVKGAKELKGKLLTILALDENGNSVNKKIILTDFASKKISEIAKEYKDDKSAAIQHINSWISDNLLSDASKVTKTKIDGWKPIKDVKTQLVEQAVLEDPTLLEKGKLVENFDNLAKGEDGKYTLKIKGLDFKITEEELGKLKKAYTDKVGEAELTDALHNEAVNALNEEFKKYYVGDRRVSVTSDPVEYYKTTLSVDDISSPSRIGKFFGSKPTIALEETEGPSLGSLVSDFAKSTADSINPVIESKYQGASDIARSNRAKAVLARDYEQQSSLYDIFGHSLNNNWEVSNGAGFLRGGFGASRAATDEEYRFALATERNGIKFGKDANKWINTPEGKTRLRQAELELGRQLTSEEGVNLYKNYQTEQLLKSPLAEKIITGEGLMPEFAQEMRKLHPEFEGMTDAQLLETVRLYNELHGNNITTGEDFLAKLRADIDSPLSGRTFEELKDFRNRTKFINEFETDAAKKSIIDNEVNVENQRRAANGHRPMSQVEEFNFRHNAVEKAKREEFNGATLNSILDGDNEYHKLGLIDSLKSNYAELEGLDGPTLKLKLNEYLETKGKSINEVTGKELAEMLTNDKVSLKGADFDLLISRSKLLHDRNTNFTKVVDSLNKDQLFIDFKNKYSFYHPGESFERMNLAQQEAFIKDFKAQLSYGISYKDLKKNFPQEAKAIDVELNSRIDYFGKLDKEVTPLRIELVLPELEISKTYNHDVNKINEALNEYRLLRGISETINTYGNTIDLFTRDVAKHPELSGLTLPERIDWFKYKVGDYMALFLGRLPIDNIPNFIQFVKKAPPISQFRANIGVIPNFLENAKLTGAFKDGGKLAIADKLISLKTGGKVTKFQNPAGPMNNMNFSNGNGRKNWKSEIFDNYKHDIDLKFDYLSDSDLEKYVAHINGMQDRHYNMYTKHGSDFTKKIEYDPEVEKYLNDYDNNDSYGYNSGLGKNAIQKAQANNRYSPEGNTNRLSGDWNSQGYKNDGLFGAITDDRRVLGRESTDGTDDWDEESLKAFNLNLAKRGYLMYKDKDTKYYKIGRLPGFNSLPAEASNPAASISDEGIKDPTPNKLGEIGKGLLNNIPWDKLMSLGNMLHGDRYNKMMLKNALQKEGTYLTPFNSHLSVFNNTGLQQIAALGAGKLNSAARRSLSSDAATNLANSANANAQGLLGILQSAVESGNRAHETANASAQHTIGVNKAIQDVFDENLKRHTALYNSKIDYINGYLRNKALGWDNFMKEMIYDRKVKKNQEDQEIKQAQDAIARYRLSKALDNDAEYQDMLKRYEDSRDKYAQNKMSEEEQADFKQLVKDMTARGKLVNDNAYKEYLSTFVNRDRNSLISFLNPTQTAASIQYNFEGRQPTSNGINYSYKKGGLLKDIREAQIRAGAKNASEFNKIILNGLKDKQWALGNLSKATLLEIKASLGI